MSQGMSETSQDFIFKNMPPVPPNLSLFSPSLNFNMEQLIAYKIAASNLFNHEKLIPNTQRLANLNQNLLEDKSNSDNIEKKPEVPENLSTSKSRESPNKMEENVPTNSRLSEQQVLKHLKGKDLVVSRIISSGEESNHSPPPPPPATSQSLQVVDLSKISKVERSRPPSSASDEDIIADQPVESDTPVSDY